MNESTIAVRYAKALFLLAKEKNLLEQVKDDILLVNQALDEISQFKLYLASPVVKPSQKATLFRNVFQQQIHEISFNFLSLLIQNKREIFLSAIFRRFLVVYRDYKGIKTAVITTASRLNKSSEEKLKQLMTSTFKSEVELHMVMDASIIGGFVLRVGDQQYDASVATGLKRMKSSLVTDSYK